MIMTSPFNKLVTEAVIIFVIIKIRVAAGARVELESTICPSQDALEFIFFQCCAETHFSRLTRTRFIPFRRNSFTIS